LKPPSFTAISCGGVVIYRGKVLLLYKNQNGRYMGWVLPKGTLEDGETFKAAALREVKEESGVAAIANKYLGKTQYSFYAQNGNEPQRDKVCKTVHWYLMTTSSFYCKPQAEEYFADVGFYKRHEAFHLLKFNDERQIMHKAFTEYNKLPTRRDGQKHAKNKYMEASPEASSQQQTRHDGGHSNRYLGMPGGNRSRSKILLAEKEVLL